MAGYPTPSEYVPYYFTYIGLVPKEGDIGDYLTSQKDTLLTFFNRISPEKYDYRYAEGKWSLREVLGHILDCERIMAYRALRIGRGDTTPIEGFEQDDYIPTGKFSARSWEAMTAELLTVREATISLLHGMPEDAFERTGTANGNTISCRALFYIIAGHAQYHRQIIEEKYL